MARLSDEVARHLATRLSGLPDLLLPNFILMRGDAVTRDEVAHHLQKLAVQQPGPFLERYAGSLTNDELAAFQPLRDSNEEVHHYLAIAERRKHASTEPRTSQRTAQQRNRRHARMKELEQEGYFEDEAMREREPALYHLYVGQYLERGGAREAPPGEPLSERLLRIYDEVQLLARRDEAFADEMSREPEGPGSDAGLPSSARESDGRGATADAPCGDRVGLAKARSSFESEHDTDESEGVAEEPGVVHGSASARVRGGDDADSGAREGSKATYNEFIEPRAGGLWGEMEERRGQDGLAQDMRNVAQEEFRAGQSHAAGEGVEGAAVAAGHVPGRADEAERARLREEFGDLMRVRFMAGMDAEMDYVAVDGDTQLDNAWVGEMDRDAEERWFDAD